MECVNCKAQNPEDSKYCNQCGTLLDTNLPASMKSFLETTLPKQVDSILNERLKNQEVLKVELAEGVANRLQTWGKLLGFFIGIPIVILLAVLGILGINTYSGFTAIVATNESEIQQSSQNEGIRATVFSQNADAFDDDYQTRVAKSAEIQSAIEESDNGYQTRVAQNVELQSTIEAINDGIAQQATSFGETINDLGTQVSNQVSNQVSTQVVTEAYIALSNPELLSNIALRLPTPDWETIIQNPAIFGSPTPPP